MQNFFTRERIIGIIGIITAMALLWLVQQSVPNGAISTLRIPYANGKPQDAPLIDIPLPTALTIYVLAGLLVGAAIWLIWGKRGLKSMSAAAMQK